MKLITRRISLNVSQPASSGCSEPLIVPDGASRLTIQFFHTLSHPSGIAALLSLEQSTDGRHFDPFTDAAGNPLVVSVQSDSLSTTINILGLLSLWVRFSYQVTSGASGILSSCNILFA